MHAALGASDPNLPQFNRSGAVAVFYADLVLNRLGARLGTTPSSAETQAQLILEFIGRFAKASSKNSPVYSQLM